MSEPLAPMPDLRADDAHLLGAPEHPEYHVTNVYTVPREELHTLYEVHVPPCPNIPKLYEGLGQFGTTNPYDIVMFIIPDLFTPDEVKTLSGEAVLRRANGLIADLMNISCSCCEEVRSKLRQ